MKIIGKGFITKPPNDKNFSSNAFPCIEKLPSGRWLGAFKASEKKGNCDFMHAVMTWSDDDGKTWVKPFEPVKLPDINNVPGQSRMLYLLSMGGKRVLMLANWVDSSDLSKPYYNPENSSLKDTRIFLCFSEDDGETWSTPELMNTDPVKDPTPLTGAPFMLKDGTIVCQFEINKHDWDKSDWVHKSAMIFSCDGGKIWSDVVKVTEVPEMYYWDQRPNVLADGRSIVDFFWTLDGKKQQYLNIHASESFDGGKTWQDIWDTGIYGQPGQPVDLGDGRIATIDIDRTTRPIITVRTSRDHGRTYDETLVVYDSKLKKQDSRNIGMDDAWEEMTRFSVGHPTLLNLGGGEILAYYYAGDHCDSTSIEFVRLLMIEAEPENLTEKLYLHAKNRIPGGVQLLSKRPENMAPGRWPAYFREARGCEIWDLDGKHYYDMSTNAVGSCLLGYRDPDVTKALIRRTEMGSMCTLNPPEEVELADLLCDIHPWAEQVRFVRGGGEACAVAVRIARATTDRSIVAVCGYHGWHDWYLAANLGENDALRGHLLPGLNPWGVPVELRDTTVAFRYNDLQSFKEVIDQYGSKLAAVIMEPCRNANPEPGFLEFIRDTTQRCGALLIFDEVTVGWRLHYGGAHLKLGVVPDISVFAKAMGNGTPIGAVIGTKAAMEGAHYSFISSTYWTESIGPIAALATLRKMRIINVPAHVAKVGNDVMGSWRSAAEKYRLPVIISGYPSLAHFSFQDKDAEKLRTLYTQLMLDRGFLAGLFIYPTLSHTDEIVQLYNNAIEEVFGKIADAFHQGTIDQSLKGKVAQSGFARLI